MNYPIEIKNKNVKKFKILKIKINKLFNKLFYKIKHKSNEYQI